MKKLVMVFALGAMLGSCGKSACDCKAKANELQKELNSVTDMETVKELSAEADALAEECKDFDKKDFEACN
jgi:hypothetical protein